MVNGIGTLIINKLDGLLFWRSTRHANDTMLHKGKFADDIASPPCSVKRSCIYCQ